MTLTHISWGPDYVLWTIQASQDANTAATAATAAASSASAN